MHRVTMTYHAADMTAPLPCALALCNMPGPARRPTVSCSRNYAREIEEAEVAHRTDISIYKQKIKHLLYEHQTNLTEFKAEYQGATWQFASAQNRNLFKANPAKYAPAYGGWCAAGASKGKNAPPKVDEE